MGKTFIKKKELTSDSKQDKQRDSVVFVTVSKEELQRRRVSSYSYLL